MIEILTVDPSSPEIEVFNHLLQLYEYEFSDITKLEVNRQGLYSNNELNKNLAEKSCQPLLLRFKKTWAGLAVVNLKSQITGDSRVRDIAEFFVLKLYRHHHLGQKMAFQLFSLFPGKWEVRQLPDALDARTLWLKVIDRFSHQQFTDELLETPQWKGYIQTFKSGT
jgi:predicted acetyltransferase